MYQLFCSDKIILLPQQKMTQSQFITQSGSTQQKVKGVTSHPLSKLIVHILSFERLASINCKKDEKKVIFAVILCFFWNILHLDRVLERFLRFCVVKS